MVEFELERLLNDAKNDENLKSELIKTKSSENPIEDFCNLCQSKGYSVTIGELLAAGQDSNDAKLRSVNGGGVDAFDSWTDFYELFFSSLEA